MARYQELPNREGGNAVCACAVVPDLTMCQNNAMNFDCIIGAGAIGKSRIDVYCTSCSFTVPAGVTSIFIEMWGAGAGGSGNGNCCCCSAGIPGGAGAYTAATIPTAGGCVYTICAGTGGNMGCGQCTSGGNGNSSYVTGFNISTFCAGGGRGPCNPCNAGAAFCCGSNWCNDTSVSNISGTTILNNAIQTCGEGGHVFGKASGCRHEAISGSAPFGGGAGVWTSYNHCCPCSNNSPAPGGQFPGGGGGGAYAACCCGACNCSGCGAAGLVRIWY